MMNSKLHFRTLVFGIALLPVGAFAQQADTKVIDQFKELNQLLQKDQKATYSKTVTRDGRIYVPATKVQINGKDTMVKTPLFSGTIAITVPANRQAEYSFIPYPNPDRIPTLKPDMSKYRMPNMIVTKNKVADAVNAGRVTISGNPAKAAYTVAPAPLDMITKLTGTEVADLAITDVFLSPRLSNGETVITFNLPEAAPAEISLTDSEGKQIWTDKTEKLKFGKSFKATDGTCYLVVKQNGKSAVKQLVKE